MADEPQSQGRRTSVLVIVIGLVVLVLGAMLLIGLLQGDDVDREENPVRGAALILALGRAG